MPLEILIVGAGVAGPALAFLLLRADPSHSITVVERAPALRQDGLQIDLRAQGLPVVRKMGLMPALRPHVVAEEGFAIVDAAGRVWGSIGKNDSGKGQQSMTSEWEIMRGDLVRVLHDVSLAESDRAKLHGRPGTLRYEFGKALVDLRQDPARDAKATATFSDGSQARYDLVVGADGQWSKTRRLLFGDDASASMFRSLGLSTAYYTVPTAPGDEDDATARWRSVPGRRCVVTRSARAPSAAGTPHRTQVYLSRYAPPGPTPGFAAGLARRAPDEQKAAWARAFADALPPRHGLDDAAEHFYQHEIGQVRCARVAEGRVALLGDAGYCPAPITGMGTTVSLVGAYVLAGELARHSSRRGSSSTEKGEKGEGEGEREYDVLAALEAYDRVVRPFVDEAQKVTPGVPWIAYPESRWGVLVLNLVFRFLTWFRVFDLIVRLMPEDKGGLAIPEYPELNLEP
ncbi:monooxygenase [Biscogniauxia mediterranea]|nr:monooxygenase [Biscogniauxia mediterranea]